MSTSQRLNDYSLVPWKIASIRLRDASLSANDKMIVRTWQRGTFTVPYKVAGHDLSTRESVRAPINAGRTVAARSLRFMMAREYTIPDVKPAFALSNHSQ
jgi:hypothetical protein